MLGDSVTARRKIEVAIKERYGSEAYEYWNCGVEGYNTYQEVTYYERFCQDINPDHVILTFSQNDFHSTPVAFYDDAGRMAVFTPDRPSTGLNPWLYQRSYLYRLWFSWDVSRRMPHDEQAGAALVYANLKKLRDLLEAQQIQLSVLVLPPCRPDPLAASERELHLEVLGMLEGLGITHFDLAPPMKKAIEDGVDVQETKGDFLHPSARVATYFADHLVASGLNL